MYLEHELEEDSLVSLEDVLLCNIIFWFLQEHRTFIILYHLFLLIRTWNKVMIMILLPSIHWKIVNHKTMIEIDEIIKYWWFIIQKYATHNQEFNAKKHCKIKSQPLQQLSNRGLASTWHPNQSHNGACWDVQVEVMKHFLWKSQSSSLKNHYIGCEISYTQFEN